MKVFVAEGLEAGDAQPEDDEEIELRLVRLSEVLKMIEKGAILDGKTLTSVLLYAAFIAHVPRNNGKNRPEFSTVFGPQSAQSSHFVGPHD